MIARISLLSFTRQASPRLRALLTNLLGSTLAQITGSSAATPRTSPNATTLNDTTLNITTLNINAVDDPNGNLRIIGARGVITAASFGALLAAVDDLSDGFAVHIDLADATFNDERTLRQLESMADNLELRGVDVRIVGIDPNHPVLTSALR
jgi:anti-anti-sigma regulatory factor